MKPPGGRDVSRDREVRDSGASVRHFNKSSAALENGVGDGGSPDPGRWEGRLNHSSRLNREPAAKQIPPG